MNSLAGDQLQKADHYRKIKPPEESLVFRTPPEEDSKFGANPERYHSITGNFRTREPCLRQASMLPCSDKTNIDFFLKWRVEEMIFNTSKEYEQIIFNSQSALVFG